MMGIDAVCLCMAAIGRSGVLMPSHGVADLFIIQLCAKHHLYSDAVALWQRWCDTVCDAEMSTCLKARGDADLTFSHDNRFYR